jgi:hypothetical protein
LADNRGMSFRWLVALVAVGCVGCSGSNAEGGSSGAATGMAEAGTAGTADDGAEASTLEPTGGGPTGGADPTSATTNTSNTSATTNTTNTTNTTATSNTTDPGTSTGPGGTDTGDPDTTSPGTTADTGDVPPPLDDTACEGYATRYWDCCKAHCGWQGNVNPATTPMASCNKADQSLGAVYDVPSSCGGPTDDNAYTCYSGVPWAISDELAYGFAAVPAQGDICGRCYQLEFDGTGHYNAQDPGSQALADKTMIVQATNIGFDVGGGQFDILTPGGGVGAFNACSYQWGVDTAELGAQYGGFMTFCQQQHPGDHAQQKQCVLGRCAAVFDDPGLAELKAGCEWYVGWYNAADNPNLRFQEVACPAALVAISGIDRAPLDDVGSCGGGGGSCTQEEMDNCDCSWTNGGQNCGDDDGSCCWEACCG